MYTQYFGLHERPFSITPDPRYLFLSERHREALAHLLYGAGEGGGFVLLTGEVGTGKTTVCRAFLERLPAATDVALILNPRLSALELLEAVCDELGVPGGGAPASIKALVDRLNHHLLEAHAAGRCTLLLIDEAQNLDPDVLEQVRLLTNLETATHKLLQVFLVGQPELRALVERPGLRQVAQRITARYHIEPLGRTETADYIRHRLQVAGAERPLFTRSAIDRLWRLSGGTPRKVNILADRALLGAYARGRPQVTPAIARRAAGELGYVSITRVGRPLALAAIGASAALAGVLLSAAWQRDTAQPDEFRERVQAQAAAITEPAPPPVPEAPSAAPEGMDEREAQSRLLGLWGVTPAPERTLCEAAAEHGLHCYRGRGSWSALHHLNRPALIPLSGTQRRYAVVAGFDGAHVHLLLAGGVRVELPLAAADRHWLGEFTLLWQPPFELMQPLRLDVRDDAVQWVRRALTRALGEPISPQDDPRRYDESLAEAVREFQRQRGLLVDGVIGQESLLHLQGWLDPQGPTLGGA